eukprot:TRINITY_DN784_c5_g3_i1.p1 TRINITY_DN784_c5_g3~~TRINITY_DN784_c5_g3_i1.p1  ORF type:complete len:1211 (+),score=380.70 TRINITY_DN784_c5_g3_i1:67-3699(+)
MDPQEHDLCAFKQNENDENETHPPTEDDSDEDDQAALQDWEQAQIGNVGEDASLLNQSSSQYGSDEFFLSMLGSPSISGGTMIEDKDILLDLKKPMFSDEVKARTETAFVASWSLFPNMKQFLSETTQRASQPSLCTSSSFFSSSSSSLASTPSSSSLLSPSFSSSTSSSAPPSSCTSLSTFFPRSLVRQHMRQAPWTKGLEDNLKAFLQERAFFNAKRLLRPLLRSFFAVDCYEYKTVEEEHIGRRYILQFWLRLLELLEMDRSLLCPLESQLDGKSICDLLVCIISHAEFDFPSISFMANTIQRSQLVPVLSLSSSSALYSSSSSSSSSLSPSSCSSSALSSSSLSPSSCSSSSLSSCFSTSSSSPSSLSSSSCSSSSLSSSSSSSSPSSSSSSSSSLSSSLSPSLSLSSSSSSSSLSSSMSSFRSCSELTTLSANSSSSASLPSIVSFSHFPRACFLTEEKCDLFLSVPSSSSTPSSSFSSSTLVSTPATEYASFSSTTASSASSTSSGSSSGSSSSTSTSSSSSTSSTRCSTSTTFADQLSWVKQYRILLIHTVRMVFRAYLFFKQRSKPVPDMVAEFSSQLFAVACIRLPILLPSILSSLCSNVSVKFQSVFSPPPSSDFSSSSSSEADMDSGDSDANSSAEEKEISALRSYASSMNRMTVKFKRKFMSDVDAWISFKRKQTLVSESSKMKSNAAANTVVTSTVPSASVKEEKEENETAQLTSQQTLRQNMVDFMVGNPGLFGWILFRDDADAALFADANAINVTISALVEPTPFCELLRAWILHVDQIVLPAAASFSPSSSSSSSVVDALSSKSLQTSLSFSSKENKMTSDDSNLAKLKESLSSDENPCASYGVCRVYWALLPGYLSFVSTFMAHMLNSSPSDYTFPLIKCQREMIRERDTLTFFVRAALGTTPANDREIINKVLDLMDVWFRAIRPPSTEEEDWAGATGLMAPLPDTFCFPFFFNAIAILLKSEHYQILLKSLTFLYTHFGHFFGEQRLEFARCLLFDNFYRLFLHWCPEVRKLFHYILIFKLKRSYPAAVLSSPASSSSSVSSCSQITSSSESSPVSDSSDQIPVLTEEERNDFGQCTVTRLSLSQNERNIDTYLEGKVNEYLNQIKKQLEEPTSYTFFSPHLRIYASDSLTEYLRHEASFGRLQQVKQHEENVEFENRRKNGDSNARISTSVCSIWSPDLNFEITNATGPG